MTSLFHLFYQIFMHLLVPGSLQNCDIFQDYQQPTSDTQDSAHDSSQSQSLIQHDLTALDLPTQVTARSFTSDINVDYESFEDSLTGFVFSFITYGGSSLHFNL